jgi:hypothetical protein
MTESQSADVSCSNNNNKGNNSVIHINMLRLKQAVLFKVKKKKKKKKELDNNSSTVSNAPTITTRPSELSKNLSEMSIECRTDDPIFDRQVEDVELSTIEKKVKSVFELPQSEILVDSKKFIRSGY